MPGCVSEGDTLDEALANIREAAEGWLDVSADVDGPGGSSGRGRVVKSISGKDFCRVLERHGWHLKRIRGSHHIYGQTGNPTILTCRFMATSRWRRVRFASCSRTQGYRRANCNSTMPLSPSLAVLVVPPGFLRMFRPRRLLLPELLLPRARASDLPRDLVGGSTRPFLRAPARRDQAEVESAGVDIDRRHRDADRVAEAVRVAGAVAGDDVAGAVVAVVVVGEAADVDEALGRQLDARDEQAEVLDAGDDAVELHADLVGQVVEQLHLVELALGLGGPLLALAAMVAQRRAGRPFAARASCRG